MVNGNVFTTDPKYLFGATLAFECNEGFELKGPETIKCLEFGWSSRKPPYCKGGCFQETNDMQLNFCLTKLTIAGWLMPFKPTSLRVTYYILERTLLLVHGDKANM